MELLEKVKILKEAKQRRESLCNELSELYHLKAEWEYKRRKSKKRDTEIERLENAIKILNDKVDMEDNIIKLTGLTMYDNPAGPGGSRWGVSIDEAVEDFKKQIRYRKESWDRLKQDFRFDNTRRIKAEALRRHRNYMFEYYKICDAEEDYGVRLINVLKNLYWYNQA